MGGVWIAVEDTLGIQFHETTDQEVQYQLTGLQGSYTVTFFYPGPLPSSQPRAQTYRLGGSGTLLYVLPINGDACPPPPPPDLDRVNLLVTLDRTGSAGSRIRTSTGQLLVLPPTALSGTLPGVPVTNQPIFVYGFALGADGRREAFGLVRSLQVQADAPNEVFLRLNMDYSLQLTGEILAPPDYPSIAPVAFVALLLPNGSISGLQEGFMWDGAQYALLLPNFQSPVDPAVDRLLVQIFAQTTLDDRGTASLQDDLRVQWTAFTYRLVGQILNDPTVSFVLPPPPEVTPPDGGRLPRADLRLSWSAPEAQHFFVRLKDPETGRVLWNISVSGLLPPQVRLPVFPVGDPLGDRTEVLWSVYASFGEGSAMVDGLRLQLSR